MVIAPVFTSHQGYLLRLERFGTMAECHLSTLGRQSIFPIRKVLGGFATLLRSVDEWCLCRRFCLWSNPRQMTPLAIRPIERCRVSRNAVLQFSTSAIVCNKWQDNSLTSQTTTVLGAHLTRTWKSWPRAIWSYRNLRRKSLSSCLYPMMWRVTIALVRADLSQEERCMAYTGGSRKSLSRR